MKICDDIFRETRLLSARPLLQQLLHKPAAQNSIQSKQKKLSDQIWSENTTHWTKTRHNELNHLTEKPCHNELSHLTKTRHNELSHLTRLWSRFVQQQRAVSKPGQLMTRVGCSNGQWQYGGVMNAINRNNRVRQSATLIGLAPQSVALALKPNEQRQTQLKLKILVVDTKESRYCTAISWHLLLGATEADNRMAI